MLHTKLEALPSGQKKVEKDDGNKNYQIQSLILSDLLISVTNRWSITVHPNCSLNCGNCLVFTYHPLTESQGHGVSL